MRKQSFIGRAATAAARHRDHRVDIDTPTKSSLRYTTQQGAQT